MFSRNRLLLLLNFLNIPHFFPHPLSSPDFPPLLPFRFLCLLRFFLLKYRSSLSFYLRMRTFRILLSSAVLRWVGAFFFRLCLLRHFNFLINTYRFYTMGNVWSVSRLTATVGETEYFIRRADPSAMIRSESPPCESIRAS